MRSHPTSHLLTFLSPKGARLEPGLRVDSPYGCAVEIGRTGHVSILGPSREAVFELAARLLRVACRGLEARAVAAKLYATSSQGHLNPARDWIDLPGMVDGWTIIVNAPVAFSPTGLDPYFPDLSVRGPVLVEATGR